MRPVTAEASLDNPMPMSATATLWEVSYYCARYYDQALGRFFSEDPVRFRSDETNLYPYLGNNPVPNIDPGGLTKRCRGREREFRVQL